MLSLMLLGGILMGCSHTMRNEVPNAGDIAKVDAIGSSLHGFDISSAKYVGEASRLDLMKVLPLIKDLPLVDKKVVSINRATFKGQRLLIVYTESWMIELDQANDGNWKIIKYGMYSI